MKVFMGRNGLSGGGKAMDGLGKEEGFVVDMFGKRSVGHLDGVEW